MSMGHVIQIKKFLLIHSIANAERATLFRIFLSRRSASAEVHGMFYDLIKNTVQKLFEFGTQSGFSHDFFFQKKYDANAHNETKVEGRVEPV